MPDREQTARIEPKGQALLPRRMAPRPRAPETNRERWIRVWVNAAKVETRAN